MANISSLHESCGYKDILEKYLVFPPASVQPEKTIDYDTIGECDVFDALYYALLAMNLCFNIYEINQQCPLLWHILSFPTPLEYAPGGSTTYFDRTNVKRALHVPLDTDWEICADGVQRYDTSAMSIERVIPQVIEATNRSLISFGDLDMILITDGTLMAVQNMTWNGRLGFQERPSPPIDIRLPDLLYESVFAENGAEGIDGLQGIMGIQHYERGLVWAESYITGHMQPQYQPRVAYRHLQWVLGRIETP